MLLLPCILELSHVLLLICSPKTHTTKAGSSVVSSPLGNRTYHTVLRLMRILPTEQVCVHVDKGDGAAYPKKRPRMEEGEEEPERRFPVTVLPSNP